MMPRSASTASPSGVVGPLAPSSTRRVWTRLARSPDSWPSSAAGISTSDFTSQKFSLSMRSAPLKPATPPVWPTYSSSEAMSMPLSFWMVPV